MNRFKNLVLAGALLAGCHNLSANVIFSDNFNLENGGVPTLNYYSFANWNVTSGSVDLIGNGYYDFYPGAGLYVDTEGSTGVGGTISTKQSFNFVPGTIYMLSFNLAGDARGGDRSEIVSVGADGSILNEDITLASSAPSEIFMYDFTVATATSSPLSFAAGENGNIGLILDNVQLCALSVPDGGNTALLGAGAFLAVILTARVLNFRQNLALNK